MEKQNFDDNKSIQKEKFHGKIKIMWKEISESIKQNYPSNLKKIPSLGSLSKKYNLHRNTVKSHILINLEKDYNQESAYYLYSEIWNRKLKVTQRRYNKFLKLVEYQFKKYYPKSIEFIMGINMIQKNIGASKITVIDWCKRYLNKQFGEKHFENVYEAVWGNKFAVKNKYTYDAIKNYMEKQNGYLLSTREEWRRMKELPSERYIRVGHILKKKRHIWFVKVRYLINQGRWCPECNNYVCERVLKLYMNKLFKVKFRPITLNRAFRLKKEDGGLLKYDAFNKNVKIGNFKFSIAAEYDGEQHDIFPNYYHKSVEDYYVQKRRDRLKDELSIENNTILIRIKASEGFNRNTINCFQEEIIRQVNLNSIIKKSNVKFLSIPKYTYNPLIKKLESNKESLEYFI